MSEVVENCLSHSKKKFVDITFILLRGGKEGDRANIELFDLSHYLRGSLRHEFPVKAFRDHHESQR